ncbi:MAG TPA: hypothetical protein VK488_09430 [Gaiellaceae bacterium]|nr:hypothetical protein [Gaiellaceae bacterium]
MRLTRRELLAGGAATAALGAAGIYELVEQLGKTPTRRLPTADRAPEQHLLHGLRVIEDEGVEVVVPPLHHQLVTARLKVEPRRADLRQAQAELENALLGLDRTFESSARGLGVTVAWGLPYFRRYLPERAEQHLPVDRRATTSPKRPVRSVIDAIRFPSDPHDLLLEENDVAVLFRSDELDHVTQGARAIFGELDGLLEMTSIRKGFAGGGFDGGQSLPKRMAVAAGVPGADLIPDTSELFLGFTSTQKAGLGPPGIVNYETLGLVDLGPSGYFRAGTSMHVSHIYENLEAWYLNFDFGERVTTTFSPERKARPGTQTVAQDPEDIADSRRVVRDFHRFGAIGHSAAIQTTSRLQRDVVAADGTVYRQGTAIPQRADFNTLDNPFFWSVSPDRDGQQQGPAAGVHFVVFNPTSDDFHRNRLAMDGVLPDGTRLPLEPQARGQGLNSVLRATHRQNFLVPPRRRRSFPLVELLT